MPYIPPIILDGKPVEKITAFLFDKGGNDDPAVLLENANKSFVGSYVLGMGFTFDDSNPDATPIAEMHRLIEKDPRNAERIFPYIGGEEVNSSPTHDHHRYVINFGDMKEDEARKYPDLMAIVEKKVKPKRLTQGSIVNPARWWMFARPALDLQKAIAQCDRVLVIPRVTQYASFAFLPSGIVYSEQLIVIAISTDATFCILQSRIHEVWTRFFSSSLEDRIRYTPSDGFETFPFPLIPNPSPTGGEGSQNSHVPLALDGRGARGEGDLESIGKTYYEFRADLMIRHNEGLTATYNRFHDPDETNPDILKLRELHAQCDRAVLDAYGWTDIPTDCEFLLDYEDEDALTPDPSPMQGEGRRGRKKPWRYRWPEEVHDEVLARLLKLNQERHLEEVRGHKAAKKVSAKTNAKPTATTPRSPKQLDLIPPDTEQLDLI